MGLRTAATPIQVLDKQIFNVGAHLATFEGTISVLEHANTVIDDQCVTLQNTADHYLERIEHAQGVKAKNNVIIGNLKALLAVGDSGE